MDYEKQASRLQTEAARLLEGGEVQVVIGLRENEETGFPTPCFVRKAEDAAKLVWNDSCCTNLTNYLLDTKGKVAIAAKSCDVRSMVNLIAEKQLNRDDIKIIGMECTGMKKDGALAPACDGCLKSFPNMSDIVIAADGGETYIDADMPGGAENVTEWAKKTTVDERFDRFMAEIDKCILCFACRQACQGCYCVTCFIDRKATPWEQVDADRSTKIAFHLTRAMHLSGRCTDCGACEKVCSSGVNLKYLYKGISEFTEERYGFKAGQDIDARPVMNNYSTDDEEVGFLGGDYIVGV